jgi:hypothetical protein
MLNTVLQSSWRSWRQHPSLFEHDCTAGLIFTRLQSDKKGKKSVLQARIMFGYTLKENVSFTILRKPLKIWAGSTPEFVVYNNCQWLDWLQLSTLVRPIYIRMRQTATLVRSGLSELNTERDISVDGAAVNSQVLKSRYYITPMCSSVCSIQQRKPDRYSFSNDLVIYHYIRYFQVFPYPLHIWNQKWK